LRMKHAKHDDDGYGKPQSKTFNSLEDETLLMLTLMIYEVVSKLSIPLRMKPKDDPRMGSNL